MLGTAQLACPFRRIGVWIEERNRQEIESGELPVNAVTDALSLLLTILIYLNQKERAQELHDTKSKQV